MPFSDPHAPVGASRNHQGNPQFPSGARVEEDFGATSPAASSARSQPLDVEIGEVGSITCHLQGVADKLQYLISLFADRRAHIRCSPVIIVSPPQRTDNVLRG